MKKTQILELLSTIRATFMSFVSIVMFVALSIGVFAGISWTSPALQRAADEIYDEGRLYDLEIRFVSGMTESDLKELDGVEGVDEIETGCTAVQQAEHAGKEYIVKMVSMGDKMNDLVNVEGVLPSKKGEIAVNRNWAESSGVSIGDKLSLVHDSDTDDDGMKLLTGDEYVITATADFSLNVAYSKTALGGTSLGSGLIDFIACTPEESFDADAYPGYTQVYIRSDSLRGMATGSEEYAEAANELAERVTVLGDKLSKKRYDSIREEYSKRIREAEAKLDSAKSELAQGEARIAEYKAELADARNKQKNASSQLASKHKKLKKAQKQYDEAAAKLKAEEDKLGSDEQNPLYEELQKQKRELEEKGRELDAAWDKYEDANKKLNAGYSKIDSYDIKLQSAERELEAYKAKISSKEDSLKNAKSEYNNIKQYDWTVLTRRSNGGQQSVARYSELTSNLRYSMAALFVIVGLLVSYSSVSRRVKDQVKLIGTKKALGLRRREITLSYLAYSASAVALGSVLGFIGGVFIIEKILAVVLGRHFVFGEYRLYFSPAQAAALTAIEFAAILATTYIACRRELARTAVELLGGETPPAVRRRFFEGWRIWKRLPLFTKTVINNCLNDRRRVAGTIIGIAGCTMLMVTALTLNNNILVGYDVQFRDVYNYDVVVGYSGDAEDDGDAIKASLEDMGAEAARVYEGSLGFLKPDGNQNLIEVTVPYDDSFDSLVHLEGEGAPKQYEDGIWISRAYAAHFDAEPGDKVKLVDSEGQIHEMTIQGVFDFYLFYLQAVMSREVYENTFGGHIEANEFIVDSGDSTYSDIESTLRDVPGVKVVRNEYEIRRGPFDEFTMLSKAIVLIYFVVSVIMAIVVLYDLYSVFIDEKKRELIVMMINGFSRKDARAYIYRDTIVLTIIGIILGIIAGIVMGNISLITLEPETAYFIKRMDPEACIIGAVTSGVLALLIAWYAMRRIDRFKLSDINKM